MHVRAEPIHPRCADPGESLQAAGDIVERRFHLCEEIDLESVQARLVALRPRFGSTDAVGAQGRVVDRVGYAEPPVIIHPVPAVPVNGWSRPGFDDGVRVSGSCSLASPGCLALGLFGHNAGIVSQGQGYCLLQSQGSGGVGPKGQRGTEDHCQHDAEDCFASQSFSI